MTKLALIKREAYGELKNENVLTLLCSLFSYYSKLY